MNSREPYAQSTYQYLHDETGYVGPGRAVWPRVYSEIRPHIVGRVIDVGCGQGRFVDKLRAEGLQADGIDWVDLNNGMLVGDITEPHDWSAYDTAVCIDVLEHIPQGALLNAAISNLATCKRVVVTVDNGHTQDLPGVELHVTRIPFEQWAALFSRQFNLRQWGEINDHNMLFVLTGRNDASK